MDPNESMTKWAAEAKVNVKNDVPIEKYIRSGSEMLRQANIYRDENGILSAYFMYTKFSSLILNDLPQHPGYSSISKQEKSVLHKNVKIALTEAERLRKPVLEYFKKIWKEREKEQETEQRSLPLVPDIQEDLAKNLEFFHSGLREILVPESLIPKFLLLAKRNTENNIETCGLLTGTLQRNRLTISVLIIPEQKGSSDDCVAENDIATFNVIDSRNLLSFGWIHTHPSQKAFLSSVDLHSQFGYQAMMPEALAIVCAPKYSNEIFRLTSIGLDVVGKCTRKGFHPHSETPLFENAHHAKILDIPCEVIDLRK